MANAYPHLHIVMLAQTRGERLWPLTREHEPACLASLSSPSGQSMLSTCVSALSAHVDAPLHIVTLPGYEQAVFDEVVDNADLDGNDVEVLGTPVTRDSAFAVSLACAHVLRDDPDAIVLVLPANITFEADDRLDHTLFRAYQAALRDKIVLISAQQDRRCGSWSYIRSGSMFENVEGCAWVRQLVIDASPRAAQRAVSEGATWHTGVFMARAARVLGSIDYAADSVPDLEQAGYHRISATARFLALIDPAHWTQPDARELVKALPEATTDQVLCVQPDRLAVVPSTTPIIVLGSLADMDTLVDAERRAVRVDGMAQTRVSHASNVTVISRETQKRIEVFGVSDLVVVDTPDALLVASKDRLDQMGAFAPADETS